MPSPAPRPWYQPACSDGRFALERAVGAEADGAGERRVAFDGRRPASGTVGAVTLPVHRSAHGVQQTRGPAAVSRAREVAAGRPLMTCRSRARLRPPQAPVPYGTGFVGRPPPFPRHPPKDPTACRRRPTKVPRARRRKRHSPTCEPPSPEGARAGSSAHASPAGRCPPTGRCSGRSSVPLFGAAERRRLGVHGGRALRRHVGPGDRPAGSGGGRRRAALRATGRIPATVGAAAGCESVTSPSQATHRPRLPSSGNEGLPGRTGLPSSGAEGGEQWSVPGAYG